MPVEDLAGHMEVAFYLHCSIVLELNRGPGFVDQPHLTEPCLRRLTVFGVGAPEYNAMLCTALLGQHQYRVARAWQAYHSPTSPRPHRQDWKPASQHVVRLEQHSCEGATSVD